MKKWLILVVVAIGGLAMLNCGDDTGGCPGMVCTDCGGSGDCGVDCQPPDLEYCGAFGYFDDPGLRCAFCAPENFQP